YEGIDSDSDSDDGREKSQAQAGRHYQRGRSSTVYHTDDPKRLGRRRNSSPVYLIYPPDEDDLIEIGRRNPGGRSPTFDDHTNDARR
ncbi:MAG: hypothetical protein Q9228_007744, partial [Teloschistes exilis]